MSSPLIYSSAQPSFRSPGVRRVTPIAIIASQFVSFYSSYTEPPPDSKLAWRSRFFSFGLWCVS
jgi:hypothetical protein